MAVGSGLGNHVKQAYGELALRRGGGAKVEAEGRRGPKTPSNNVSCEG